jgi:glycosyltransferase involved in cell wall biosynthesis
VKVSIITATYNSASTIDETLRSVKNQHFDNIEHIIIDGLSSDQTLDIVRSYPHIAHVVSAPDQGIYDAMNKGIGLATGDIVGILNSDDFYVSDTVISDVVSVFDADPGVQCVYADLMYVDPKNTDKIVRKWKSGPYSRSSFLTGWMPPHPTFFVRRDVYHTYGIFNTSLSTAADYELMLRFLYLHKASCKYLPKTIIKMRSGGASNQSLKARLLANKQDRLAWAINGLTPRFYTLYLKPLRKIVQYCYWPYWPCNL